MRADKPDQHAGMLKTYFYNQPIFVVHDIKDDSVVTNPTCLREIPLNISK
jgi:hypothetical protein